MGAPAGRVLRASAPHRVCDNGGWTDTWFAGSGQVCNIAVEPAVEVELRCRPAAGEAGRVVVDAAGDRYELTGGDPRAGRQPLLEACVAELPPDPGWDVEVRVRSAMPPGAATGTSAAVAVALLAALDALRDERRGPGELAALAHRVETDRLGLQSGVQDQLAAAHGGVSWIEVGPFPAARVEPVEVPAEAWDRLDSQLVLVYLGRPHRSSAVHEMVIADLELRGGDSPVLAGLRDAAAALRAALAAGDLGATGAALTRNTELQAQLHPALVGEAARAVIGAARAAGALGWKVNGAGGDGGSVSVLTGPDAAARRRLVGSLAEIAPGARVVPTRLRRAGVTVAAAPP